MLLYVSLSYNSRKFLNNKIKLSFASGKECLIAPISKCSTLNNILIWIEITSSYFSLEVNLFFFTFVNNLPKNSAVI